MSKQYKVTNKDTGETVGPMDSEHLDEAIYNLLDGRRWKWSVQIQKLSKDGDVLFEGPWKEGPWNAVADTMASTVCDRSDMNDYFRIRGKIRVVGGIQTLEVTEPDFKPRPPLARTMPYYATSSDTPWGTIYYGGACRDSYGNIHIYRQDAQHYLKMQQPAINSIKQAENHINGKIYCTGSGWRSCTVQAQLWRADPGRYANPSTTAHTRGLAIDINMYQSSEKRAAIKRALLNLGWHQAREYDEPWHYSFGIEV